MHPFHRLAGAALATLTLVCTVHAETRAPEPEDPWLWLEEVESERALEWVRERNDESLGELQSDDAYALLERALREVFESDERIPMPTLRNGYVYNFWQDARHERGIWRRSPLDAYLAADPEWETLLDLDALGEEEDVNWVWKGAVCADPEAPRCIVQLSRGGADAVVLREFDLERAGFVADGFEAPEAKTSVAWLDPDRLLIATDFGEGSLTASGYAREVRLWARGEALADAQTLLEIPADDVGVWVSVSRAPEGPHAVAVHLRDFFNIGWYLLDDDDFVELPLPGRADVETLLDGQAIVRLREDWTAGGHDHAAGTLLALPLASLANGDPQPEVLVEPGARQTIRSVHRAGDTLLVNMLDNVTSRLLRLVPGESGWQRESVDVPELGSVGGIEASAWSDGWFYTFEGFLDPAALHYTDEDGGHTRVRSEPSFFDKQGLAVSQHEATSADGTRIPYFLIGPEETPEDPQPTVLSAYGGFEISRTPAYSGVVGRSWLEAGGTHVVANIRGGGEFGPSWHQAALRENRMRAFEDLIAVAEDLVERGITTPAQLGIIGGSNGGLLVGAAVTLRPDLFGAVASLVPLLDMRRYHRLLAGASWVAEYGNPDDPDDWAFIREYSPYHNVDPDADYPRMLFTTSTRDDRVHPGHARKMVARLREHDHPVHYFENIEGGHAGAATAEHSAKLYALVYTYFRKELMR